MTITPEQAAARQAYDAVTYANAVRDFPALVNAAHDKLRLLADTLPEPQRTTFRAWTDTARPVERNAIADIQNQRHHAAVAEFERLRLESIPPPPDPHPRPEVPAGFDEILFDDFMTLDPNRWATLGSQRDGGTTYGQPGRPVINRPENATVMVGAPGDPATFLRLTLSPSETILADGRRAYHGAFICTRELPTGPGFGHRYYPTPGVGWNGGPAPVEVRYRAKIRQVGNEVGNWPSFWLRSSAGSNKWETDVYEWGLSRVQNGNPSSPGDRTKANIALHMANSATGKTPQYNVLRKDFPAPQVVGGQWVSWEVRMLKNAAGGLEFTFLLDDEVVGFIDLTNRPEYAAAIAQVAGHDISLCVQPGGAEQPIEPPTTGWPCHTDYAHVQVLARFA